MTRDRDGLAKALFTQQMAADGYSIEDAALMWAGKTAFAEQIAACYDEADAQLARLALARAGISATG